MAENRNALWRRSLLILGPNDSAGERAHAEDTEVIARDVLSDDGLGLTIDRHLDHRRRIDLEKARDRLRVGPQIRVERIAGAL